MDLTVVAGFEIHSADDLVYMVLPADIEDVACVVVDRSHQGLALVDALNETVIEEGGRIYLAKDSFTRPEHFRAMEPRLDHFLEVRKKWDPKGRIRSAQSVRLFGDRA